MPIYIPEEIPVVGKTYRVVWKADLHNRDDSYGKIWYQEQEIIIQPEGGELNRHRQAVEGTFFHELVHAILHAVSEYELRDNENFVNRFSQVLYQALRDSGMLRKKQ